MRELIQSISFVSVPACSFQPWDRRPSSLQIELVHTGASISTKSIYPRIFPLVSQLMWFASGSNVIVSFFGVMCEQCRLSLNVFLMCVSCPLKKFGCIIECCHMVDS